MSAYVLGDPADTTGTNGLRITMPARIVGEYRGWTLYRTSEVEIVAAAKDSNRAAIVRPSIERLVMAIEAEEERF